MPAGRPPKPTHLHILDGTYRGDRHAERAANEPELQELQRLPKPPKFLGNVGRREWKRIGQELLEKRVLTVADLAAFAGYCASLDRAITAETELQAYAVLEPGFGLTYRSLQGIIPRPQIAIAKAAWGEVRRFAQEFGITPSARTRVRAVPAKDDAKKPADPWDEVMNG